MSHAFTGGAFERCLHYGGAILISELAIDESIAVYAVRRWGLVGIGGSLGS